MLRIYIFESDALGRLRAFAGDPSEGKVAGAMSTLP
jgi:hypothetical protein